MNAEAIAIIPPLQEAAPPQPEQAPAEPHATLLQKLGELPTKAAIYLDIKTSAACDAVAGTLHTAKDYLKQQGGRLAAHTYLAALAVTGGGLGAFLKTNTAHAEAQGPRYTVTQAAKGGIFSRTTPNWEDTPHIIGQGIYPNDVLTLECGVTDGSPVGQYNNTTWYFVHNNSRNEPDFWANDHYLDTPNTAGHIAPDVTVCPNKGPNPMEGQNNSTTTTAVTSVFFSPIPGRANGLDSLARIADKSYALEEWTSNTKCSNDKVMQIVPESANTLAGWSVGRLGPIYYLAGATKEQKGRIHTVVLFDPGNSSDFSGGDACDARYDVNHILGDWLQLSPQNRLIIYTGIITEESPAIGPDNQRPIDEQMNDSSLTIDRRTFAGLWKYYLAGIWNQPFAHQAQVCDYTNMSHDDTFRNFAYTIQSRQTTCPTSKDGQLPTAWNP